jgi:hypothetical protein
VQDKPTQARNTTAINTEINTEIKAHVNHFRRKNNDTQQQNKTHTKGKTIFFV